ncbi:MAG: Na+/H+ antiporter NhaA, partial [Bacteroidetes bacterium]|nr:Na+/H+ antiporter NhaA [Bacteroidota bacterium]
MASPSLLPEDRPVDGILSPINKFIRLEASSGVLLLLMAVLALVLANTTLSTSYFEALDIPLTFGFGSLLIQKPLLLWINDGLMAIFFFLVGLEIKREVLTGELSSPRQALLPIIAAVGGMVIPAGFYVLVTGGTPFVGGWGIPMATDIAFALGILALLGSRAPVSLKIFLTALAIIDDLGAVLVIAIFYTSTIKLGALIIGFGLLAVLALGNRLRIQKTSFYVVFGILLWLAFLKSGVHATIAGVLLALTIPARRRLDAGSFKDKAMSFLTSIRPQTSKDDPDVGNNQEAIHALEVLSKGAETPLTRMEHALHGWVAFFIMPVFALANAGVDLRGVSILDALMHPVALGIIAGLFIGKQVGVAIFSWLAIKLNVAEMPKDVTWRQLYAVAILTGVGFTMSLFI